MMKIKIDNSISKLKHTLIFPVLGIVLLTASCNGSGGSAATSNTYNTNSARSVANMGNDGLTSEYVYAANYTDNSISMYKIEPGGMLAPLTISSIATGKNPIAISIAPNKLYAYVVNFGGNSISTYSINQDNGVLTQVGNPLSTSSSPSSIAIAPNGIDVYVVSYANSGTLSHYVVSQDGTLQLSSKVTTCVAPTNIKVDNTGQFAYIACSYNLVDGNIYLYSIDQSNGQANFISGVYSGGEYPTSLAISSSGKFVYASSGGNGFPWISLITTDSNGVLLGATKQQLEKAYNDDPSVIVLSKDNKFAYATNVMYGKVSMFSINQDNGALTYLATPSINANGQTVSVVVDENSQYVYAANCQTNTISMFAIDQATGVLTALSTKNIASGKCPAAFATALIGQ